MILRFLAVPSILEYFRGERRGGGGVCVTKGVY